MDHTSYLSSQAYEIRTACVVVEIVDDFSNTVSPYRCSELPASYAALRHHLGRV